MFWGKRKNGRRRIEAAAQYARPSDLWVITCYFNPHGYQSRLRNYTIFRQALDRSGINCLTVECAFGQQRFVLPETGSVRLRCQTILWQKERLLNVALAHLPPECRKVAWMDADILFVNPDWAVRTSGLLERYAVVQLFDRVIRLPQGQQSAEARKEAWRSFGAVYARRPQILLSADFARHGHTGFGWAARREVLAAQGFFDTCIAGSGDHVMAHAFCGDWQSGCIQRVLDEGHPGGPNHHMEHFVEWSRAVYSGVRAAVGYVPGTILHLWHGETADRRYVTRNRDLAGFAFDPRADVRVGAGGCWEWNSDKPALHQWAIDYFRHRKEDGETCLANP
jgi:hypothetical protein